MQIIGLTVIFVLFPPPKNEFQFWFVSELQKDETENTAMGEIGSFSAAQSSREFGISLAHPYYDVARHGIIHSAGTFVANITGFFVGFYAPFLHLIFPAQ